MDLSGAGINIVEEGTVVKAVQTSDYYAFLLRSCEPNSKNVFKFEIRESDYLDLSFGIRAVLKKEDEEGQTFTWTQEWEFHVGDGSVYSRKHGESFPTPEKHNYTPEIV